MRFARHQAIVGSVRDGAVSVRDLVVRHGVSESTIRRDLIDLAEAGLIRKVHGGAAPLEPSEVDRPYAEVADDAAAEKRAIARCAAAMVRDGDSVLLDIGTTVGALAHELRGRAITVISSSIAALDVFRDDPLVELILLGGLLRRRYHSLVGPLTEETLRHVRATTVFLGTSGISSSGDVLDTTSVEVPTKRGLIAAADRVVLLADHGKFPGRGSIRVCGMAELSALVTTRAADSRTLDLARAHGAEVVLA